MNREKLFCYITSDILISVFTIYRSLKLNINLFREMIPRRYSTSLSRTQPPSLPTVIAPPELTLENASDTSDTSSRSRRVSQVSHCSSLVSAASGWNPPEFVLNTASDSDSSRRVSTVSSHFSHHHHSKVPALSPGPVSSRRFSSAAESQAAVHLDVPQLRERNYSLPSTVLTEELYKMRMFSVKGRKVVNHGDSIQSRRGSRTSISSRGSAQSGDSHSTTPGRTPRSGRSSALSSRGSSRPVSRQSSPGQSCPGSRRNSDRGYASSFRTSPLSAHSRCSSPCLLQLPREEADLVRVLILGAAGVGKSSLCAQFVTSEYVNTYHQVGEFGAPSGAQ